jgi:PKHD-type hydroxylase
MREHLVQHPGLLAPSECELLVRDALERGMNPAHVLHGDKPVYDPQMRKSRVLWITQELPNKEIDGKIKSATRSAAEVVFKADHDDRWIFQLSQYEKGDRLRWHIDDAHYDATTGFRKFVTIIQLSNPDTYTGGDLLFENGPDAYPISLPREQGGGATCVTHRQHQVSPIRSGVRYSMVAWLLGPRWR